MPRTINSTIGLKHLLQVAPLRTVSATLRVFLIPVQNEILRSAQARPRKNVGADQHPAIVTT
jgi:hypothetical protein